MIWHLQGNRYSACNGFCLQDFEGGPHSDIVVECGHIITITPSLSELKTIERITVSAEKIYLCDGAFANLKNVREIILNGRIEQDKWVFDFSNCNVNRSLFQNSTQLRYIRASFCGACIMPYAFSGCESLVALPDLRVRELGLKSFKGCRSLKEVHLHNGLENLGVRAFEDCSSLEDIYIPDTVNFLGVATFSGCISLKRIHLPDRTTRIPDRLFYNCRSLEKCFLPDGIRRIDAHAFDGCESLRNPWIPKELKEIGDGAFANCTSITEIMIPETVEKIGEGAFDGCPQLRIKGFRDSVAERYARENNIPFIVL